MQFFSALLNLDSSYLAALGLLLFALFSAGAGAMSNNTDDEDANDYDNASWNPSSVNYNE